MKFRDIFSPNYIKKKGISNFPKFIIIHYTGMQSERECILKLCNPASKVSCHYLINEQGKIFRMVDDINIAWHAGKSNWKRYKDLNKNSLGIELVNKGHRWGYTSFKKKQIVQLIKLCKFLIKKYKIKKQNILGHSDIAPFRKYDPGEKFPWQYLAKKNLGVWHNLKPNSLIKFRKIEIIEKKNKKFFFQNLKKIGYFVQPNSKKIAFRKITSAFQRHFRKELINGLLDMECLKISINLAKKYSKNT